jgi:hypothetical protein
VLCCAVLCSTVLWCGVLLCAVLSCIILLPTISSSERNESPLLCYPLTMYYILYPIPYSVLSDLEELLDPVHEHALKCSIVWLIKQFEGLDPTCKSYSLSRSHNKGTKEISMEERKKKARERAMKAMKASANRFATHVNEEKGMAKESDKDIPAVGDVGVQLDARKGQETDAVMGQDAVDGNMAVNSTTYPRKRRIKESSHINGTNEDDEDDEEEEEEGESCDSAVCIVCQVRGEQDPTGPDKIKNLGQGQGPESFGQRKIGYIAFSQYSRAWNSRARFQAGMRQAEEVETPVTTKNLDGDVHLSFCGHGE